MANLTETSNFDAGVTELQTTDPVQGGTASDNAGASNAPLVNLTNRTRWLYNSIASILTTIAGLAPLVSPVFTGSPAAPTPASGDSSTKIPTTAFVQDAYSGNASVSVAGNSNVVLTQAQWGPGIVTLTGILTGSINVVFPTQTTGRNRWLLINATTGPYTITAKTAGGSGVAVTQGASQTIYSNGTNISVERTDFVSVALTGASTAVTQSPGDSTTKIATDAFVMTAVSGAGAFTVANANGFLGAVAGAVVTLSTTITGLMKGNGTAMSAATPGTDYLSPAGGGTVTAPITFAGSAAAQSAKFVNATEMAALLGAAPGSTFNFNVASGAVQYHTVNAANNWTTNFEWSSSTSLNAAMAIGDVLTVSHLVTQGTPSYYPTAFTIDGSAVTPKWQGGLAPTSGDVSSLDVYTYTIIKTGSAAYTVLASQTKYA